MAALLVKRAGSPSIPGYPENSEQRIVNRKVFIISVIALEPSSMIVEMHHTAFSSNASSLAPGGSRRYGDGSGLVGEHMPCAYIQRACAGRQQQQSTHLKNHLD